MARVFDEFEREILKQAAIEIEEFRVDFHIGISHNKFVMCVPYDATWADYRTGVHIEAPTRLKGTWMMAYEDNLLHINLQDAIERYEWVRCHEVSVTTTQWVEL